MSRDEAGVDAPRAGAPGRFVWPPRPVVVDVADPGDGALEPAEPAAVVERPAAARAARREGLWRSIERVWLGLEVPPWADRAAEAGWAPDGPGAYCGRCGSTTGPHEADGDGCTVCRGRRLPWDRFVRLGEYAGELREAVVQVKFTRWRRLGDDLGRLLGESLLGALDTAGVDLDEAVIVPVPTSFRRRVWRGIDHSLVIARGVGRVTGIGVERLLEREHRPSQLEVAPSRRAANAAGSMRPRKGADVGGRVVVVVDDVRTTGATMAAAARAVRRAGQAAGEAPAGVWAAVVGVTPDRRERRPRRGGTG